MSSIISEKRISAALVLADGTIFKGYSVGANETVTATVTVNADAMGYQETITDAANDGKIIVFAYPHIGNVGIDRETLQNVTTKAKGIVIRCPSPITSHFTATGDLGDWLVKNHITAIADIDTRRLVRHLRDHGAQTATIVLAQDNASIDEAIDALTSN